MVSFATQKALLEDECIRFASQPLAELDEPGFLWIEEGSRVMEASASLGGTKISRRRQGTVS